MGSDTDVNGSNSGNTPTRVGWIAAFVVGAAVFAVLRYPVGFMLPSSIAFGIAAILLFILLLSSSGSASNAEGNDSRVRRIVPQPEPAADLAPRASVMPNRVTSSPKPAPQPVSDAPFAPVGAADQPSPVAEVAAVPQPIGFVEAPPAAAELVSRRKPAASKAAAKVAAQPEAKAAGKPKPAGKPKAAKTKAPLAAEGGLARLTGPRGGKADDLKEIEGIGPALEKLVNGLGFYHFDQIAGWSEADVALVDAEMKTFKGRITRDKWVAQARIIVSEGLEAFRERAKTNNY